jgi:hypothetical protein
MHKQRQSEEQQQLLLLLVLCSPLSAPAHKGELWSQYRQSP